MSTTARDRRVSRGCVLLALLLGLAAGAAHGQATGWSGTLTERVEFGYTFERPVTGRAVAGPFGKLGYEAAGWRESRDLEGARTVEVSVVNDVPVAAITGHAAWYVSQDAAYRRGACLRPLFWAEGLRATVSAPGEAPTVSVTVGANGRYRIQARGAQRVRFERETHWRDVDACGPGVPGEGDTGIALGELAGDWKVEAVGETCDGHRLAGTARSDWRRALPRAPLPGWVTDTARKAGGLALPGSLAGETPWVRTSLAWDLRRPGGERPIARCAAKPAAGEPSRGGKRP